eukprot:TRINITY_DN4515_c0_g3_i1.p1 TRINITY_DN4515_c0_g3~~TRINITY_DN4515_c0_g3_i1.p1  ORF type:complete len:344 (+),score=47.27 TRINITY_DN4515_c0_g3_i1:61-1092(+)
MHAARGMAAALLVAALASAANGIMFNHPAGEGLCDLPKGSTWAYLEEEFLKLGYQHFHCSDPSGGYCSRLAAMGDLSLKDLRLPKHSHVLFYGHSYLREVYENLFIANFKYMTEFHKFRWTGFETGAAKSGEFSGCGAKAKGSPNLTKASLSDALKHYFNGDAGRFRFESLNTTVYTIINYAPLQNPSCMAELDRFLQMFHFDVVMFMRPHGNDFDQYVAARMVGAENLTSPVDLATMEATGTTLDEGMLSAKFKKYSDYIVFVEPWTRERVSQREHADNASAHADVSVILNDYVHLNGSALCSEPACASGDSREYHQCQPGTLTLAARDLSSKMRSRPLARE